jgi:hypothetical protein
VIAAVAAVSAGLAVGPAFAGDAVMWGGGFSGTPAVFAASAERFAANEVRPRGPARIVVREL